MYHILNQLPYKQFIPFPIIATPSLQFNSILLTKYLLVYHELITLLLCDLFFNHGVYYLYIQIYRSKEIHKDFDRHGRRIIVLDDPSDKMRERLKLYKNNRNNKRTIVPSSFGARAKTVFLKYFTCILYICDTFFFF